MTLTTNNIPLLDCCIKHPSWQFFQMPMNVQPPSISLLPPSRGEEGSGIESFNRLITKLVPLLSVATMGAFQKSPH